MANEVTKRASVLEMMGAKYNVDPDKFYGALKKIAFSQIEITPEESLAFCLVANQYNLNPLTKEIYAIKSKKGAIIPVVGIDGWIRLANENPQYDGMDTIEHFTEDGATLVSVECVVYRKDRSHPTRINEYLVECTRDTEPWKQWPVRMLRNKAISQGVRLAFGFAGIYEPDEAERIAEAVDVTPMERATDKAVDALQKKLAAASAPTPVIVDVPAPEPGHVEPVKKPRAQKVAKQKDPENVAQPAEQTDGVVSGVDNDRGSGGTIPAPSSRSTTYQPF